MSIAGIATCIIKVSITLQIFPISLHYTVAFSFCWIQKGIIFYRYNICYGGIFWENSDGFLKVRCSATHRGATVVTKKKVVVGPNGKD